MSANQLQTLSDQPTTQSGDCSSQGVSALRHLVSLDVSQNQISTLDGLRTLSALESLNLEGNLIRSVQEVAKLSTCAALRRLVLQGNPIAEKR